MKKAKLRIEDFHKADPIPHEAIERVVKILKSARLFRYSASNPSESEVALLEKDFAEYLGVKYALALNSCSSAIYLALICSNVKPGDKVLVPSFTFTAVPSSIIHVGAIPVLVECNDNFQIDLDDLERKMTPKTKVLLLSHMRGHTSDMDKIVSLCNEKGVTLIEDSAHSLGVLWSKKPVGTFGKIGTFSFQSYKIINAGEGGMLVTDDEETIVKAIYLSGAYEKSHEKHFVESQLFDKYRNLLPAYNLRMNNVSAAIIRPQLDLVETKIVKYLENYELLASRINQSPFIEVPHRDIRERMAPDSIQFHLKNLTPVQAKDFMNKAREKGVSLYVFGADKNNARLFWNWKYIGKIPELNKTRDILNLTCDMRLPYFFNKEQINYISEAILSSLNEILERNE